VRAGLALAPFAYEMLGRRVRCARRGPLGWPRGGCFGYCAALV